MPDPTVTLLASGPSSTALTTVSFSAQSAGTLLVLCMVGDDYRTTSGTGRPESTGFTLPTGTGFPVQANLGLYVWYKLAAGSETSVQYTIGSASHSTYQLYALTNIDQTTPFDIAAGNFQNSFAANWTTPAAAPTTGRRCALAVIGGSTNANDVTGFTPWTNSYTEVGDTVGGTSPQMSLGAAQLALDGNGVATTNSNATFTGNGPGNVGGITAVFQVASGAAAASTPGPVNATTAAVQRASSW